MSGRHRNDIPEGSPGDNGNDPARPTFGPADNGTSDWFSPRQGSGQAPPPPAPEEPPYQGGSAGGAGGGGYGDSSDTGGYRLRRPPSGYGSGGGPSPSAMGGASPPADSGGYGQYESIRSSDGGPAGPYGGRDSGGYGSGGYGSGARSSASGGYGSGGYGSGGYGSGGGAVGPGGSSSGGSGGYGSGGSRGYGSGGYGSNDPGGYGRGGSGGYGSGSGRGGSGRCGSESGSGSGDYGSGDYGTGGYGTRRKQKRSKTALIGPMAGAVGLALLLGVGVYAFAANGGGCADEDAITLNVAAAPDIHPAVVKAATRFNEARNEAAGKCVKANVTSAEPASITTLLSGQGVATGANKRPDVWIPDTSLWTSIVSASPKGKQSIQTTKTSLASSPIVVGLPQTLATQLKQQGITATPSWDNLLKAAGGTAGGGVTKNQMIPAGSVRLLVPDPARNGAGMGALMVTNTLLTNDPNREAIFTGIVRTVRESMLPTVNAQFAQFRKGRTGKQPISLSSEQALWNYNRKSPAEPAVALYPVEGTLSMDYPFTVTTSDSAKKEAARVFERAMNTEATRNDVRAEGFRSPDGKAPDGFNAELGVSPSRPRQLPVPKATEVAGVMQAWAKLTLGLRMLTLIDVSGSMLEEVAPGTSRLQAIAQVSQGGLSMMSDDTELGQWFFTTNLDGNKDWKETVSMGPLGQRIGSVTRRQLVLSNLQKMRPVPTGDTGLYDTMLAAYKYMNDSFKPEFGNSILLLTDGKNDDPNGPSLKETLSKLKQMRDPNKPIQVNMIGFGPGVDRNELEQIARATGGATAVAQTPQEISKIFLQMLSRRIQN